MMDDLNQVDSDATVEMYISLFKGCVSDLMKAYKTLMEARGEIDLLTNGHELTAERRQNLRGPFVLWRDARNWFTTDAWAPVTLLQVCNAAGCEVVDVRRHYKEWLYLPFTLTRAWAQLEFLKNVGTDCRKCISIRREAEERQVPEGGTLGQELAGPDTPCLPRASVLRGTQETGGEDGARTDPDGESPSEVGV